MSPINPLAKYKDQMGYTYDEMAEQFGISRSVIQRAIEGAYHSLPPRVSETLAYVQGQDVKQVNREYELYVNQELHKVTLPPVALDHNTLIEDFDIWASVLLRINGVNFVGEVPKLAIARLLKLNVAVIQRFYSGDTAHLPAQILERVDLINEMKREDRG